MDARTRYVAESLRATFALARLLGIPYPEIARIVDQQMVSVADEFTADARRANPEPDGA